MDWKAAALRDIAELHPGLVHRHGWAPAVSRAEDRVDLFTSFTSQARPGPFVLLLRYLDDWQVAGRREDFLNPDDRCEAGTQWWPRGVPGVNPDHSPPAICLRGYWGFHSVLHPGGAPAERPLGAMLRDLQTQLARS